MNTFKYTTISLSDDKLLEFQEYHEKEFEHKRKYTKTVCRYNYYDKQKPLYLHNIIEYAAELLTTELGITNFVKDKNVVEFHQINLFGESDISSFKWHQDIGIIYPFKTTYTVIFYLRKDSTVKGGDLQIRPYIQRFCFKVKKEVIEVSNGKVMMFDGSMEHKPCKSSGFGCRDIIVVFFHKK
jgi:hypothetical protein